MRVLMTADAVGGVWTYALELAQSLLPHNVEVTLATMGSPLSAEQASCAANVSNLTVYSSEFKLEWMDDPWRDVDLAGRWLLDIEQALQPDVVHLNGYAHGTLPWSAPLLIAGHSCVLSWWSATRGEEAPAQWNRYRVAVRDGLRAADMVVAPTRAMLCELEKWYGPLPASRLIANGRDATHFAPVSKQALVLAAGRMWDEAKNFAALEAVAPFIGWPICVAGEACHPDSAAEVGRATQGLHTLGMISNGELAARMAAAAVYALPARYEPFGLSALEAGLSGCALVLGDIASLREVWGDAALFVEPDDHAGLAAAINSLIADEAMRTDMGARANERALGFSAARCGAATYRAYTALAGGGS